MFTTNERAILEQLRLHETLSLAELASKCGIARSSAHAALHSLTDSEVIESNRVRGRSVFRIVPRDALERTAARRDAEFRAMVLPPRPDDGKPSLVFTDSYILPEAHLQQLRSHYDVTTFPSSIKNARK